MNRDKMYPLNKFCCICLNKSDLIHLFDVDNDGVQHYNKLTSSIPEMNFKEMNNQRLICRECCVTLNTVYNFRQMCLRSKTNLITYISQLQMSDHDSDTIRVYRQDIKPELIVVKNVKGSENECIFEGSRPQIKFQTESYKEIINFSSSVKEECEGEDDISSTHENAMVHHMNEVTHIDVKVEDVEHQTMMEDFSEYYTEFNKIDIKEDPLAEVKELVSDNETPQDGSIRPGKGSEATTISTGLLKNTEKNNEGLHQCEICQKNFKRKDNLKNHMQTHSSERPYKCEKCKKAFKHKTNFNVHMKTHSSERPYECEVCKKSFYQKSYLTIHMETHSSERPYECKICKKGFKHNSNLIGHIKTHSSERSYECEICKKGFKHKSNLTVHMKIHSDQRPYECEICKKGFYQNSYLTVHMEIHSGERPYECEICKNRFKNKSNLTGHMKTHSSERPHQCEICKKRFNYKSSLTVHMETHSSERPYECEICKKRFDKKTSCISHMKRHSDKSSL